MKKPKNIGTEKTVWTITTAAHAFGIGEEYLRKLIKDADIAIPRKGAEPRITMRNLYVALCGDEQRQRSKLRELQIEEKELAKQAEENKWVEYESVKQLMVQRLALPLNKELRSLGSRIAATANPSDPALAAKAIDAAVNEVMRTVEEGLEK